jgi:hypothetical protein
MNIKKIIKTLFHPMTIKIVTVICILWFFFILPTFAAGGTETSNEVLKNIQSGLNNFISLCSRLRVVLAILAGKLMTNDFVYGGFLHMDIYLWKIRNIMKNFANFALVALVLGSIIKSLIGKEAMDIKKVITNTLVAGILIQASWFLMGAVIDLSTVATAGISAFPISFLKNDAGLKNEIRDAITKFKSKRYSIDLNNNKIKTIDVEWTQPSEDVRQNILPSYNSVSGPFVYLGMWVFHFQDYLGTESTSDVPTLTLWFILRFFLLFFFTIWLLLLFIANIMRIGLLRIFIIGAPFLILIQLFKLKTWEWWGILKLFSLSNLIAIVFKPVIFVIGISMMLIVIVSMQHGMLSSWAQRETNLNGVTLWTSGDTISTLAVDGVSNISVDQTDILWSWVIEKWKNIFSEIIMLLLTLFLMRRFVKLSLTIWGGPIEETMKKFTGRAEDIAKSAPVLPFKWGAASVSALQTFGQKSKSKLAEWLGMNTEWRFTTAEQEFGAYINQRFLGIQPSWTTKDTNDLQKVIDNNGDFINASIQLGAKRNEWLSINNSYRRPALEAWLGTSAWKKEFKERANPNETNIFDRYFKGENSVAIKNRMRLHVLMWWDDNDNSSRKRLDLKGIPYNDLVDNVYHKSSETWTQAPTK